MKKKIICLSGLVLVSGLCISYLSKDKEYNNTSDNKALAVYIKNDEGNYIKGDNIPGRDDGFTFNSNMSLCNGSTVVGWDNEEWGLELSNIDRENTECFLYFDK